MRYRFGEYQLDTERHALEQAGVPVKLERKVYQVLAYLVQHRERLVARDELLEHVWPGVYVAEAAVTRCIAALRQAVGDDRAR
jgi:DNA-binding winged helix-turn-helix (wHTH) protein